MACLRQEGSPRTPHYACQRQSGARGHVLESAAVPAAVVGGHALEAPAAAVRGLVLGSVGLKLSVKGLPELSVGVLVLLVEPSIGVRPHGQVARWSGWVTGRGPGSVFVAVVGCLSFINAHIQPAIKQPRTSRPHLLSNFI
jgi:hypothetical protein